MIINKHLRVGRGGGNGQESRGHKDGNLPKVFNLSTNASSRMQKQSCQDTAHKTNSVKNQQRVAAVSCFHVSITGTRLARDKHTRLLHVGDLCNKLLPKALGRLNHPLPWGPAAAAEGDRRPRQLRDRGVRRRRCRQVLHAAVRCDMGLR